MHRSILLLVALFVVSNFTNAKTIRHDEVRKFPDDMMFGAATASYQVEGAWDEDGKTENIWDHLTHTQPCAIKDCLNGDIADDSYHNVERDVEMMRELGLGFYRFSLSWNRILPTSFPDKINEAGVAYYNKLIDEMLKYNIEPMITLYHWDLPQKLQLLGGWANPEMKHWFGDYARVCFELFGDRVKYWLTMNEPREICHQGYGVATKAPLYTISGIGDYYCAHNLLLSHANAYHIYDKEYRPTQGGTIGITISAKWLEPESEIYEEAAHEYRQFDYGLYANPIFSDSGNYPQVMIEKVAEKSAAQGFARSRLPAFTDEEVDFIRGSADFFGLNHYTTYLIYRNESLVGTFEEPSFYNDVYAEMYQPSGWEGGQSTWLKTVPSGFYKLLTDIRKSYNNPPVFITENGFSTAGGLQDDDRINYYRAYWSAMLDAIEEGSNIPMYAAWSLMDNFEWMNGYTERFGLYEVDYSSERRTRTPRKSAFVYKEAIRTHTLDFDYEPETMTMAIDEGH